MEPHLKPFITVALSGRLGNNCMQIMTAISHAWRNGVEYKIPSYNRSKYTKQTPFDFFPLLTPEDEAKIEVEHRQDGWTYEPLPFTGKNMRLHGWYQNINYFDEYRKELIEAFNLPKEKIDAVCVHVRRGDYAKYPTKWPMLPKEYYEKWHFKECPLPCHVFSDEDVSKSFVGNMDEFIIGGDPLETWLRMTTYKFHVIANSTYSWTAAYLSGSDNVIAPHHSKWYGKDNQHIFTGELIPKQWAQIMF
jgi:hypothetical protein